MMTRRIMEGTLLVVVLARPVFGATRLWAHKTFAATQPGSLTHSVADLAVILFG